MRRATPTVAACAGPLRLPSGTEHRARAAQRGAALLMAMLTVTLVATFAATALWQQWRAVEIEAAERARAQSAWVLVGALDWARLILREDGRASQADHLAEPWAVPLQESRMSTFLAADRGVATGSDDDLPEVFLSGRIVDLQSRLNLNGLVSETGDVIEAPMATFTRLFELLGLPPQELAGLVENLRRASLPNAEGADVPLRPQRFDQLAWLRVAPSVLQALQPYVTLLPERTPVNLNTASAQVLAASIPGIGLAGAERLVDARARTHLRSVAEAKTLLQLEADLSPSDFSVQSQYFEVQGRMRVQRNVVNERSLVKRPAGQSPQVTVLWRERAPGELLQ